MGAATDAALLARIVRSPGRICLGPTTKSGSFPFGGVSLGFSRENDLDWNVEYYKNLDPSSGAILEIARRKVEVPVISLLAEGPQWDEDLVQASFSRTTLKSSPTPVEARIEGSMMPGVVHAWQPILFYPYDTNAPCVYFRRPAPVLSMRKATALAMARKAGLPLLFYPLAAQDYQFTPYWQIARLGNLNL